MLHPSMCTRARAHTTHLHTGAHTHKHTRARTHIATTSFSPIIITHYHSGWQLVFLSRSNERVDSLASTAPVARRIALDKKGFVKKIHERFLVNATSTTESMLARMRESGIVWGSGRRARVMKKIKRELHITWWCWNS